MWNDSRLPQRFWNKLYRAPSGCWEWQAYTWNGYAQYHHEGRTRQGYRVAYEVLIGPIPNGMSIDHLCRNRGCCNPSHLEPVSPGTNTRRGNGQSYKNSLKTHCPQGHPYSEENTYVTIRRGRGHRHCRKCIVINNRAYLRRKAQRTN